MDLFSILLLTFSVVSAATLKNATTEENNNAVFINAVHNIAASISKNLVIHDNRVVWSPFLVVNVIQAINNNNSIIKNGFESAFTYLETSNLNMTKISSAFTKGNLTSSSTLEVMQQTEDKKTQDFLQEKFSNVTGNKIEQNSTSENLLEIPSDFSTTILTTFGVESLWETPFHPRYAKKGKFYLNSTHVVKTKFMNNIGFYKFYNGSRYNAVALPLKETNKVYLILMTPTNVDGLEELNQEMDNSYFTNVFDQFKTKRVQLSVPRVNIDSQFLLNITEETNLLSISSMKLSFTGLYNSFRPPTTPYRPIKFTRLRRRKDDMKMSINSPFLFYLYDSQISGILLSGIVMNPIETHETIPQQSIEQLETEIKLDRQESNDNCFQFYENMRKSSDIYTNLNIQCLSNVSEKYKLEILKNANNSEITSLTFQTGKSSKPNKFYRNEIEFEEIDYFQFTGKVKYMSFAPADFKIVKVLNFDRGILRGVYFLIPNERSGLALVEESLGMFERNLCQMRETMLRLQVPLVDQEGFKLFNEKIEEDKKDEEVPFDDEDSSEEGDRESRKSKNKNKRYRKVKIDRPFVYIVTEESNTQGGIISIGRFLGNNEQFDQTTLASISLN